MTSLASLASLDTVIIFTTQMETLAEFYATGLGIGPYETSPGHLGCKVGSVYFGFDQVEALTGQTRRVTLWFTMDDLQGTFDHLVQLGAEVRYPPMRKPWGRCWRPCMIQMGIWLGWRNVMIR